MIQLKSDLMIRVDDFKTMLGLNKAGLSPKTTLFTLNKIIEMILQYLLTQSMVAPQMKQTGIRDLHGATS